jgi:hypothetical protein
MPGIATPREGASDRTTVIYPVLLLAGASGVAFHSM